MSVYRKTGQVELTRADVLLMFAERFRQDVPEGEVVSIAPEDIKLDMKQDGRIIILHDPKWNTTP